MSARLSRRSIAKHVAERLIAGDDSVIEEMAGMLIAERREREADLIVSDIESWLDNHGVSVVTVESARKIDDKTKDQIQKLFSGKKVYLREVIRPELIGGCRIITAKQILDTTLAKKLTSLRTMKV